MRWRFWMLLVNNQRYLYSKHYLMFWNILHPSYFHWTGSSGVLNCSHQTTGFSVWPASTTPSSSSTPPRTSSSTLRWVRTSKCPSDRSSQGNVLNSALCYKYFSVFRLKSKCSFSPIDPEVRSRLAHSRSAISNMSIVDLEWSSLIQLIPRSLVVWSFSSRLGQRGGVS